MSEKNKKDWPSPENGHIKMTRLSKATDVGDCWVCGRRSWYHCLPRWLVGHLFDPIQAPGGFLEIDRLHRKYSNR